MFRFSGRCVPRVYTQSCRSMKQGRAPRNYRTDRNIPVWNPLDCSECLSCVHVCKQNALRPFWISSERVSSPQCPPNLKTNPALEKNDGSHFSIQAAPHLCNGCGDCVSECMRQYPKGKSCLTMQPLPKQFQKQNILWDYLLSLPLWTSPDTCTQCGKCISACPTDAMRAFYLTEEQLRDAPPGFPASRATVSDKTSAEHNKMATAGMYYSLSPTGDCTACQKCIVACEVDPPCLTLHSGVSAHKQVESFLSFAHRSTSTYRMNEIIKRKQLANKITELVVKCPNIARSCLPGHFVIVRMNEGAERIPLTIADFNRAEGTITLVIQDVGASTNRLCALRSGDRMTDVLGPLGHPSEIQLYGRVVVIGGGVGIAPAHPVARDLRQIGNYVTSIIGAKNKDLLFWEDEMRQVSDSLVVTTDDGSHGDHGLVTKSLQKLIDAGEQIDLVFAVGPAVMMSAVEKVTNAKTNPSLKGKTIPTVVSINSVMVDGTGMCGGCRVSIGDKTLFTCVDGPEFDAHLVNFKELLSRQGMYKAEEDSSRTRQDKCRAQEQKIAKKRTPMPEQDPKIRNKNFEEVALGYTPELARAEARRCLQCVSAPCSGGCPVMIDIPKFIKAIADGDFRAALEIIKDKNCLPGITGRVCPQETQCERKCVLEKEAEGPIAIGRLERFVADYDMVYGSRAAPLEVKKTGKKVAMIGGGPASLTCAGDLAKLGYDVTIFEALHKMGGVLVYGIPEFRLPKRLVQRECDYLMELGVKFELNRPIGPCGTVQDLMQKEGWNSVFIATGAGLPWFVGIPGENLNGVITSNEYLTRVNLMKAFDNGSPTPVMKGRNVCVVGGGNVAMDAARCAVRMGADNVYLVYRRTRAEMPARAEEIHHAFQEGVKLMPLTAPIRIIGNDQGWVTGVECLKMELSGKDKSGRPRPVPVKGSEHVIAIDQFIVAIGNGPNPMLTKTFPEMLLNKNGNIVCDKKMRASVPGVFAGGDIVTGAATVIEAMGAGKIAAQSIHEWLSSTKELKWPTLKI
eukprot:TRINITY_DN863_c0_g1_i1.p1 TRINITY_DN863_c0_g1~~TRINITY_DN863_c0_g1_i1.p1  ORF type:complete len:1021 (-),score=294.08 TRINITY_DN863_c0_g1_i1:386-3448(-)